LGVDWRCPPASPRGSTLRRTGGCAAVSVPYNSHLPPPSPYAPHPPLWDVRVAFGNDRDARSVSFLRATAPTTEDTGDRDEDAAGGGARNGADWCFPFAEDDRTLESTGRRDERAFARIQGRNASFAADASKAARRAARRSSAARVVVTGLGVCFSSAFRECGGEGSGRTEFRRENDPCASRGAVETPVDPRVVLGGFVSCVSLCVTCVSPNAFETTGGAGYAAGAERPAAGLAAAETRPGAPTLAIAAAPAITAPARARASSGVPGFGESRFPGCDWETRASIAETCGLGVRGEAEPPPSFFATARGAADRRLEGGGVFGGDQAPAGLRVPAAVFRFVAIETDRASIAGMNVNSRVSRISRSRRAPSIRSSRLRFHASRSSTVRVMARALAVIRGFPIRRVSSTSLVNARSRSSSIDSALLASKSRCRDANARASVMSARETLVIPNGREDSAPPTPPEVSRARSSSRLSLSKTPRRYSRSPAFPARVPDALDEKDDARGDGPPRGSPRSSRDSEFRDSRTSRADRRRSTAAISARARVDATLARSVSRSAVSIDRDIARIGRRRTRTGLSGSSSRRAPPPAPQAGRARRGEIEIEAEAGLARFASFATAEVVSGSADVDRAVRLFSARASWSAR
jgi:hypothetical protein